ncbi:MAG: bile acid:sodium symporter family protein [Verrucomicrobiota bacterium]
MIVNVILPIILGVIMFSLGLGLRGKDFSQVLQFPKAFGTGLVNQLVLLPLIGFGITLAFQLKAEIAVGMMILTFCPGGVTTNVLTRLVKGNVPLSISLTAITSLLSILTVPFLVALVTKHFMGADAPDVNIAKLGIQMFLITAVPVFLGMLLTRAAPGLVEKISGPFSKIGLVLFVLIVLAALAKNWEVVWTNLPTLGPALIVLNVVLLIVGILTSKAVRLGPRDASTIAIESGIQNGTLGIAVGTLIAVGSVENLPPTTVPAAVYGITMYLVSMPFIFWRRKIGAQNETA